MKPQRVFTVCLLTALALAASAGAAIQDENILLPLPPGFKLANRQETSEKMLAEFVPSDETVDHWSKMITERIFRSRNLSDAETYQSTMLSEWKGACPGGDGRQLSNVKENGYGVSYWSFNCPLNPKTNLSESMIRKVVVGKDAMYEVQYAFRKPEAPELIQSALTFLQTVSVCDTRTPEHPCPAGLKPVEPAPDAAPNATVAFLHAADANDFTAMAALMDRGSAGFVKHLSKCYLRRVYKNKETQELIAAWMCSEGQDRSRVILANIVPAPGNKVSIVVLQDRVNDIPAPARTGSAFAD
jgi:hypothetical protein